MYVYIIYVSTGHVLVYPYNFARMNCFILLCVFVCTYIYIYACMCACMQARTHACTERIRETKFLMLQFYAKESVLSWNFRIITGQQGGYGLREALSHGSYHVQRPANPHLTAKPSTHWQGLKNRLNIKPPALSCQTLSWRGWKATRSRPKPAPGPFR